MPGVKHLPEENGREHGEENGGGGGEVDYVPHAFFEEGIVACAESLSYGNAEARAHSVDESNDKERQRACRTYGGKGVCSDVMTYDGGVHHVVKLLHQVSEQDRQTEAQHERQYRTVR